MGKAYLRKKDWGRGMRQFKHIQDNIAQIYEDQMDFHTYCHRRFTLISYSALIKLEDELFGKQIFQEATTCHINALIELDAIKDTIVRCFSTKFT